MGTIGQHHASAGWVLVLLVAFAIASRMILLWLRHDLKVSGRSCLAGTLLIFTGAMMRFAVALPTKALMAAEMWTWAWWWGATAEWVSAAGALLIVTGLVVMLWPALYHRMGRAAIPLVLAAVGAVYAAGVGMIAAAALWL